MSRRAAIDVFRYLDYRVFLADHYRAGKTKGLSYRSFSKLAGLSSPNYLKLVIDGARNLTPAMAVRFATACRLHGEPADYFQELVRFNQAADDRERNEAYQRLGGFQRYRRAQKLELAHAAYHAHWYVPAIRELVASPEFREDPAWIARRLSPGVDVRKVQRALDVLLELKLLDRDDAGRLVQATSIVSTGAQTADLHIGNYHRGMLERASDAIETVPAARRDISSLTLRVRERSIAALKERLARFRRELLELEESEEDGDQIVQLNLQLFPLTREPDDHATPPPTKARRRQGDDT